MNDMNAQDWMNGYLSGRQSAIDEIIKSNEKKFTEINSNISSTENTLKRISKQQISILERLKNIISNTCKSG